MRYKVVILMRARSLFKDQILEKNSSLLIEHHFTVRAMTEKYTRVYKKVIAASPGKNNLGRSFSQKTSVTSLTLIPKKTNKVILVIH